MSVSAAGERSIATALDDIREGLTRHRLWWSLAQEDIRQAYRQTVFGVVWAVASFMIFAAALLLVFTGGRPTSEFAGYVGVGLLVWNYMQAVVIESSTVFVAAESYIKGLKLPLTVHVFRCVARITVTTLYAGIGAVALLVIFRAPVHPLGVAAIPAVLLILLTATPVQILLGTLCTYSRDFKYIIDNLMRPAFFVTPIFWTAPPGSIQAAVERYNPFTHFIQIVRAPIIYGVIPTGSWYICLAISAGFWIAALLVLKTFKSQIVFWI